MGMYKAVYKCRMCGKVFKHENITDEKHAVACLEERHIGIRGTVWPSPPRMTETHICDGGSLGLADFQGWQKEE